jgi:xylulokinase
MYLGIDVGTSSVKAVLIDEGQKTIASETAPLEVSRPHSGWSEQNPDDWWTATGDVLDRLVRAHAKAMSAVRGIGLSGHMHGATLIDKSDKPLRP